MNKFREKIQNKILNLSESKKDAFLFLYSFWESFLLIVPPADPFLIYVIFTNTKKWIRYTTLVILASVLGGVLSYFFGLWFFSLFENWILSFEYFALEFFKAKILFQENSFWAIFIAAFTPVPYTVFTLAAGVFKINFFTFLLASIIGRTLRFLLIGVVSYQLGKRFAKMFMKYLDIIALVILVLIVVYLLL